jgi:nicotinamidase/pyrazinamidase
MAIRPAREDVLIVIDVQHDFLPGGALAVPDGGAMIAEDLDIPKAQLVIRKGHHHAIDSYSAFMEADRATPTGLAGYLRERGLKRVFCAGLATDFCVAWTALDARRAGFETLVVEDACRAIDTQGSLARAWADMDAAGVRRVMSSAIARG